MPVGLHEIVHEVADAAPEAIALIHRDRTVGYAELDALADRYAGSLADAGVREGDLVPVLLPRGVDLVATLLGVLKAGAAYALVDPAWPRGRIDDVLTDLKARIVVGARHGSLPVWLPSSGSGFEPVPADPGDPCCVFFTSGTTGRPKGVLTPHRAISRLFRPGGLAFGPGTVMPSAAPQPWDAFALELWGMLLTGGTSVLVDEPYLSPAALRAGIAAHGVNCAWLTASLFNLTVDEDIEAFAGLGQLLIGGERLSVPHVRRFLQRHPDIALTNGYGPVENTVFTSTHRIVVEDCAADIPIGVPVVGTEVHVLRGDEPCAVGESGELCLSGDGLALGYLGPDGGRFAEVTLHGRPTRVYRSGDLGQWDARGRLHYEGRVDRQVKVRGHRIEPGEVERQLEALPRVRLCVVLAKRDSAGTAEALVAFCVPADPSDDLTGLGLAAVLPSYQVPVVVAVAEFPLTANGKLDEQALLGLLGLLPFGPSSVVADDPDPTVRQVARVFAAVLGRGSVSVDVPFTELGGTSLDMGRVASRLAAESGVPVPVSRVLGHPTARALAAWLDSAGPSTQDAELGSSVPLSTMQVGFLTTTLLEPAERSTHCLNVWLVDAALDVPALRTAVQAVHRRHEPLRSAYTVGRVATATPGEHPAPEPIVLAGKDSAPELLREALSAPLDLGAGEVWRVALVPMGGRTLLGYVVHHIAFDGWSESVLAADLATAYNAAKAGKTPEFPPIPGVALTWSIRQRELANADLTSQRTQLATDLKALPELAFPTPRARDSPPPSLGGGPAPVYRLNPSGGPDVDQACGQLGPVDNPSAGGGPGRIITTMSLANPRFGLLFGAYAAAVADLTGSRDFGIGVPVSTRSDERFDHTVGCHIDMVCVRCGDGDPAEAARRAFRAQDVSFGDVVRLVNPPRSRRTPLFQNIFAFQNNAPPVLPLDGVATTFVRGGYLGLPAEVLTEVWPEPGDRLRIVVNHRAVVDAGFAGDLAARFVELLETPR